MAQWLQYSTMGAILQQKGFLMPSFRFPTRFRFIDGGPKRLLRHSLCGSRSVLQVPVNSTSPASSRSVLVYYLLSTGRWLAKPVRYISISDAATTARRRLQYHE